MNKIRIAFRFDADMKVGMGHLRRSLALAEAFSKTCSAELFVITRSAAKVKPWVSSRIQVYELSSASILAEVKQVAVMLERSRTRLLIVDHYSYKFRELKLLKKSFSGILLRFDDIPSGKHYGVEGVINHNIYAPQLHYPRRKGLALFLGSRYALIPQDIAKKRGQAIEASLFFKQPKVYISVGGAATREALLPFVQAFKEFQMIFPRAVANVVCGLDFKPTRKDGGRGISWIRPEEVSKAMSYSNVALSASGVTTYELAYLGIPSVLFVAAGNQKLIADAMCAAGCSVHRGNLKSADPSRVARSLVDLWNNVKQLKTMSSRGRRLIDGKGAVRLASDIAERFL